MTRRIGAARFATLAAAIAGTAVAGPARATPPTPGYPEPVVQWGVQKGETCEDIARSLYGSPTYASLLQRYNHVACKSGAPLREGLTLVLPEKPTTLPDATLRSMNPDVRARPGGGAWSPAATGMPLFSNYNVNTLDAGRADIQFIDRTRVFLAANTLVVIYGTASQTQVSKTPPAVVEVEAGEVKAGLAALRGDAVDVAVKGGGRVSAASRDTVVQRRGERTTVEVFDGKAGVTSGGKAVTVPTNFGTRFVGVAPPAPPRPLPLPPVWAPGGMIGDVLVPKGSSGKVDAAWSAAPGAKQYRIELSHEVHAGDGTTEYQILSRNEVAASMTAFQGDLEPGTYKLSVRTIDKEDYLGVAAEQTFHVVETELEQGTRVVTPKEIQANPYGEIDLTPSPALEMAIDDGPFGPMLDRIDVRRRAPKTIRLRQRGSTQVSIVAVHYLPVKATFERPPSFANGKLSFHAQLGNVKGIDPDARVQPSARVRLPGGVQAVKLRVGADGSLDGSLPLASAGGPIRVNVVDGHGALLGTSEYVPDAAPPPEPKPVRYPVLGAYAPLWQASQASDVVLVRADAAERGRAEHGAGARPARVDGGGRGAGERCDRSAGARGGGALEHGGRDDGDRGRVARRAVAGRAPRDGRRRDRARAARGHPRVGGGRAAADRAGAGGRRRAGRVHVGRRRGRARADRERRERDGGAEGPGVPARRRDDGRAGVAAPARAARPARGRAGRGERRRARRARRGGRGRERVLRRALAAAEPAARPGHGRLHGAARRRLPGLAVSGKGDTDVEDDPWVLSQQPTLRVPNPEEAAAEAMAAAAADVQAGQVLAGRYELVRLLGAGGMGKVWKGTHLGLGISIAVKTLHPSVAASPSYARRFRHEAHAASLLNHPNVVRVLDFGEDHGTLYMVMEYLEGRSLGALLEERSSALRRVGPAALPPLAEVVEILTPVVDAFQLAHSFGIVHRDLKPDNVFLASVDNRRTVKVVDFGLAHVDDARDQGPTLTSKDVVAGTPEYMSPEQCRSLAVGPSADLYAIGCLLTEMLQLRPPFTGGSAIEVLAKQMFSQPPPLARPQGSEPVPPLLERLRMDLLAKEPDRRPKDAAAVKARLLEAMSIEATEARLPTRKGDEPLGDRAARAPVWTEAAAPHQDAQPTTRLGKVAMERAESRCVGVLRLARDPGGLGDEQETGLAAHGIDVVTIEGAADADARGVRAVLIDAGERVDAAVAALAALRGGGDGRAVLVCAAGLTTDRMNALVAAGAADVLRYPVASDKVARKLERLLKRGR